ncbi:DUF1491 family protein [Aurantiacibacter luteus]|uniref:GTP-binding protein Era n=1 Tax=Aurantiacibacter luteus TaxID=1581420 RepID=A0A0G9MYG4_9SPHN|nr:DUF1491 family protein [Aurantiacibacter luteus]KLE34313.1 hypothetical protein AAW00_08695 [Aurantiacibacter luteus]
MDARLPVHLEVSGLIRQVQAAGGFATVIAKGERDAGTLIIICGENGTKLRAYERMPQPGKDRKWVLAKAEDIEDPRDFADWCDRRRQQDPDLWILEIDIRDGERFLDPPVAKG